MLQWENIREMLSSIIEWWNRNAFYDKFSVFVKTVEHYLISY